MPEEMEPPGFGGGEAREDASALLADEALLRRVLQRQPELVKGLVSHAAFLKALFARRERFDRLLQASSAVGLDALLAGFGEDGARPSRDDTRLRDLLADQQALEQVFAAHPELVERVVENPAFVEQVKVRRPHLYQALLDKGLQRFAPDAAMAAAITAERERLAGFTPEGTLAPTAMSDAGPRLIQAAGTGDSTAVQELLAAEVNPDWQNALGETALIAAAREGRTGPVQQLLSADANPDLQEDKYGWTALMYAGMNHHLGVVQELVRRGGADAAVRDHYERTALMWAASGGDADAVACLLADAKADPNAQDKGGMTPLMHAAVGSHLAAALLLLAGRANPNLHSATGHTALMQAAYTGQDGMVYWLLQGGANPNLQNDEGYAALMYAAMGGRAEIVRLLLDQGADPRQKDHRGKTARDWAADPEIERILQLAELAWRRGPESDQGRGR